jgi:hypothetical protein
MNMRKFAVAALAGAATAAAAQQPFNLDPTFRTNIMGNFVLSIAPMVDGTILLSGAIKLPNYPLFPLGLAKIQSNGSLINSYLGPGGGIGIVPWQDKFYVYGGIPYRLLADGQQDTTFKRNEICTGLYYTPEQAGDYHVFPDGRVVLCGTYGIGLNCEILGSYGLVWVTNTGLVDTTRTPRTSTYSIYKIKALPDGKFICYTPSAGLYEGTQTERIFRIEADGALDTTFHAPHFQYGWVNSFLPLANGKTLVAGRFILAGIADTLSWVRLMPDGQIDLSFNNTMSFNLSYFSYYADPAVTSFLPIGEDKLIVTGGFDAVDGDTRGGIALIDTAGNLLADFFTGNGCGIFPGADDEPWAANKQINGITPAPDGSYYIYGAYKGYDDGTTNDPLQGFVSRLYGFNVGISEQDQFKPQPLTIAPNPTAGSALFSVEQPLQNAQLTLHDASGRVALQMAWPAGSAQCRVQAGAVAPGAYVATVASSASATVATNTPQYSGRLVVLP